MGGGGGGGHLRGIIEYMFCLVKGEFYRKEREKFFTTKTTKNHEGIFDPQSRQEREDFLVDYQEHKSFFVGARRK